MLTAVASLSLGWSWADALDAFVLTNAVMGLAFGGCGALLAWHRPGNPIGWLFLAGGLLQAVAAAVPGRGAPAEGGRGPTAVCGWWSRVFVYSWPWAIGLCIPLALLLFPDGRPLSPGWRWVSWRWWSPARCSSWRWAPRRSRWSDGDPIGYLTIAGYDHLDGLWMVAELRTLAAYLLALVALVVRYRRGTETARRQLLWLLLAMVAVIAAIGRGAWSRARRSRCCSRSR